MLAASWVVYPQGLEQCQVQCLGFGFEVNNF